MASFEDPESAAAPAAPEALTPASELDILMLPITASGLEATLAPAAAEQVSALTASGAKSGKVQVAETECYRDGCALTLFSTDSRALADAADQYTESPKFFSWSGAKFRSGVIERGRGRFEVTWILYADGVLPNAPTAAP